MLELEGDDKAATIRVSCHYWHITMHVHCIRIRNHCEWISGKDVEVQLDDVAEAGDKLTYENAAVLKVFFWIVLIDARTK